MPNSDTLVIALTANAISGARERFLKEGFTDYMTKPIDGEKLEEPLHDRGVWISIMSC